MGVKRFAFLGKKFQLKRFMFRGNMTGNMSAAAAAGNSSGSGAGVSGTGDLSGDLSGDSGVGAVAATGDLGMILTATGGADHVVPARTGGGSEGLNDIQRNSSYGKNRTDSGRKED